MSPILSLDDALHDSNSMAAIDAECGQGVSLDWVKGQLLDVFRLCGAIDQIASIQVVVMARRIRRMYFYLSLSELTYFFESFVAGAYGTLYVGKSVNTQNVMAALRNFDVERANKLTEIAMSEKHEIEESKVASPSFAKEVCDRILKKFSKVKI